MAGGSRRAGAVGGESDGQHLVRRVAPRHRPPPQRAQARWMYQFSKDCRMHEAMIYFTLYSYSLCSPVRTLRRRDDEAAWQRRTPAMSDGLSDHVWSLKE